MMVSRLRSLFAVSLLVGTVACSIAHWGRRSPLPTRRPFPIGLPIGHTALNAFAG